MSPFYVLAVIWEHALPYTKLLQALELGSSLGNLRDTILTCEPLSAFGPQMHRPWFSVLVISLGG